MEGSSSNWDALDLDLDLQDKQIVARKRAVLNFRVRHMEYIHMI